ncbi:hypothetical protein CLV99_1506 [Sphingobacterium yanglingense]|uniref:Uncharacterized protein n=1 Tax=Sphingobacterium yanglingense TaxID=1437280 RepID=A0A4R6WMP2_9SPHI|nr:hypothetical protein CLV99_1506 [Sphingobacterium yanglingense]
MLFLTGLPYIDSELRQNYRNEFCYDTKSTTQSNRAGLHITSKPENLSVESIFIIFYIFNS